MHRFYWVRMRGCKGYTVVHRWGAKINEQCDRDNQPTGDWGLRQIGRPGGGCRPNGEENSNKWSGPAGGTPGLSAVQHIFLCQVGGDGRPRPGAAVRFTWTMEQLGVRRRGRISNKARQNKARRQIGTCRWKKMDAGVRAAV